MSLRSTIKGPWWALRRWRLRGREAAGDRRFNIDTAIPKFGVKIDREATHIPYEPLTYAALRTISDRLALDADDHLFDLGCGKGRVVCFFAAQSLGACVGVEYDADLAVAARLNAMGMCGRRAPTEIITDDAANVDYADATVMLLYNPFGAETLRNVLGKVEHRSDLTIAYCAPVHEAVFGEFPAWREDERFRVPYDLGGMDVILYRRHGYQPA